MFYFLMFLSGTNDWNERSNWKRNWINVEITDNIKCNYVCHCGKQEQFLSETPGFKNQILKSLGICNSVK